MANRRGRMATLEHRLGYDMFIQAESFLRAGELLLRNVGNPVPDVAEYAITANFAFAIEIALKALLVNDRLAFPESHELKTIFDALPANRQQAIEAEYNSILTKKSFYVAEFAKLRQENRNPENEFALATVLAETSDAFVRARYPFDPQYPVHGFKGLPLQQAIWIVIGRIEPNWKGAFQNQLRLGRR